jgi:hypothetical protein
MRNLCDAINVIPVNHSNIGNKHFTGNYTFKKKDKWISQLDWAFVSSNALKDIDSFRIIADTPIKSDHAALEVAINRSRFPMSYISFSARSLGMYSQYEKIPKKKVLKYEQINQEVFKNILPCTDSLWYSPDLISTVTASLLVVCSDSRMKKQNENIGVTGASGYSRWRAILAEDNPKVFGMQLVGRVPLTPH